MLIFLFPLKSFAQSLSSFAQGGTSPTDPMSSVIKYGLDWAEELLRSKLGINNGPPQQSAPPPPPASVGPGVPISGADAGKKAVESCIQSGMSPEMCQALSSSSITPPANQMAPDDAWFALIQGEIAKAQPGEVVSYLDLNFSDLMMVSFLQMMNDRMSLLGPLQSQAVPTLKVITTGITGVSSLISKANLPKSTATTPMDAANLGKSIIPWFPRIKFNLPQYDDIYRQLKITSSQKGGVLLVFTQPGLDRINGRIRIIPHADTKTLLASFVDKVSTQMDIDLQNSF